MRIPLIVLAVGLAVVTALSLLVREPFLVGALSLTGVAVICGAGWHAARRKGFVGKRPFPAILAGALVLAGIGLTNAPLKTAFAVWEPAFDRLGRRIADGERPDFPVWIGPFKVVDGGMRTGGGVPYLITSGRPFEINGFVRDPEGKGFNLWSLTRLGESWAYIEED